MPKKGRDFEEVVRQIARSEDDVDKVLKAAKLQRAQPTGWSREDVVAVMLVSIVLLLAAGFVAFMVLAVLFD